MSVFDFPRVNFQGTLQLNPGTANNADYAQPGGQQALLPESYGEYAGHPLSLIDSQLVKANTYGMSDDEFIAWAAKPQTFDLSGGGTQEIIPAEWNYSGGMNSQILGASVVGVQTGPGSVYDKKTDGVPLSDAIGAQLSFNGNITDINSEGSPPATQFFISQLTLAGSKGVEWISATPFAKGVSGQRITKGTGLWINFFRNVNQVADAGSGTYVYHVIEGAKVTLPGFDRSDVAGVVLRYYLSLPLVEFPRPEGDINPKTLEIAGSFTPLLAGESIQSGPTGRQLISLTQNVETPKPLSNNSGSTAAVALAPAVLRQSDGLITADLIGTFPDRYDPPSNKNPKYDFGPVSLVVSSGGRLAVVGDVEYQSKAEGNQRGWLFDFDISRNEAAQELLEDPDATFELRNARSGETLLQEVDFYIVSNQLTAYGEQHGPGDELINQGTPEALSVSVYHRGVELAPDSCPPVTVWQYRSVPIQEPGDAVRIADDLRPGQTIPVDTEYPGDYLFTFGVEESEYPPMAGFPPQNYGSFAYPAALPVTWAPQISVRILPNDEDFSRYYLDPNADEPVGTDELTFDVVYEKVLRTYYLLYPAMNKVFPLDSEEAVRPYASAILDRTSFCLWLGAGYMPRTRDLSASRRALLRAWCRKVKPVNGGKNGGENGCKNGGKNGG